ncbi:ankyrin repeat-containing domain protein [Diplogelasinospora grovesii]|uniref:Ankyrin repeat-containing domain protein n=1 Tax=Diplogelasinospora grovesii TaxID=303347 RepID=A0AAN6N6B2_9PEZI|nr:ankyrin repeat-containing domain protein [Diplogelasinospora grovesii]
MLLRSMQPTRTIRNPDLIDVLHDPIDAEVDDVNALDATGSTALHIAAGNDNPLMIQDLLGHSARMDIADINGSYPMHRAVRRGNSDALDELLKNRQADVNVCDKFKLTPMHTACQLDNNAEMGVEAMVSSKDREGKTLLHLASENGMDEVVADILARVNEPAVIDAKDGSGLRPLHLASKKGHTGVVRHLITAGPVVYGTDKDRNMAIHMAAEAGHLDIVEALLDALPESVRLCLEKWDGQLPNWATDEEGADNAFLETLANIGALVNHHSRGWEVEQTDVLVLSINHLCRHMQEIRYVE